MGSCPQPSLANLYLSRCSCSNMQDHELGQSTRTVAVVAKVIFEKYHSMGLHKKIGPLSTANSDGASQFRKGMGTVLS